eukprot:jgi/Chlat1/2917/Chrsp2S04668
MTVIPYRNSLLWTCRRWGGRRDVTHHTGARYAEAPKAAIKEWTAFTKDYFLKRTTLATVLLLVDASIPPQPIDLECIDWLGGSNVPVSVVFTKCDKQKKKKKNAGTIESNVQAFEDLLSETWDELPPFFLTSAKTGQGKQELLNHIASLRNYWTQP